MDVFVEGGEKTIARGVSVQQQRLTHIEEFD